MNRKHILQMAAAAVVTAMPSALFAASYASQLSLTNDGTNNFVNFRLNDAADSVDLIINGTTTSFAGPFTAGTQTLNVGATAPASYQVVVRKNEASGYIATGAVQQIGIEMPFFAPRGVAINNDPTSQFFGRVYVGNAVAGTTSAPFPSNYPAGRFTSIGIFAMNADLSDAIGQGDTGTFAGAESNFSTANSLTPTKVEVGQDGNLYIIDWSNPNGGLYRADGNLADGSGINVLTGVGNPPTQLGANHADISGAVAIGSEANGNLTIFGIDSSFGGANNFQRLFRWDAGSSAPTSVAPVMLANPMINHLSGVTSDLDRNVKTGNFYMMQNRSVGTESGIFVISPDGERTLWSSLAETRAVFGDASAVDILRISRSVKTSPDGNRMVIVRDTGNMFVIPLLAGVPDIANTRDLDSTGFGALRGDAAFDIAGNLYETANSDEWLRVFTAGGNNVIVTGSDGTATAESLWSGASGSNFNTSSNWLANNNPGNASGSWSAASFGQSATPTTVNIDGSATVSTLRIKSSGTHTVAGGNLVMDGFAPNVVVEQGSHTISAPVQLNLSTGFAVVNAADTLTVSGALTTAAGVNIIKGGAGTVQFTGTQDLSNVMLVGAYDGTLSVGDIAGPSGAVQARVVAAPGATINATGIRATKLQVDGTVNLATNGNTTAVVNHDMTTGALTRLTVGTTGKLNMNDNDIVVDYTLNPADVNNTTPEFTLRDLVLLARDGDGSRGIFFTETAEQDTILAFGLDSELAITEFNGVALDGTAVVGKYTYYGDANFDGQVTTDDYVAVDLGLGTGNSWVQGDFDLNGIVTTDDYVVVDLNLGKGTSNPLAFAEEQAEMIALHTEMFGQSYVDKLAYASEFGWVAASVPEPGALSLVGLGAMGLLGRRRRRSA